MCIFKQNFKINCVVLTEDRLYSNRTLDKPTAQEVLSLCVSVLFLRETINDRASATRCVVKRTPKQPSKRCAVKWPIIERVRARPPTYPPAGVSRPLLPPDLSTHFCSWFLGRALRTAD